MGYDPPTGAPACEQRGGDNPRSRSLRQGDLALQPQFLSPGRKASKDSIVFFKLQRQNILFRNILPCIKTDLRFASPALD